MRAFQGQLDPTRNEVPGVTSGWNQTLYNFLTTDTTQNWTLRVTTGMPYNFTWGDGTSTSGVGNGADQAITHNYAGAGSYAPSLQLSHPAGLLILNAASNGLSGSIPMLTNFTSLTSVNYSGNALTGYAASVIATTVTTFNASNNALSQSAVDQILADFATNIVARPSVGSILLNGGTNAYPSAAGLASKALILAIHPGWTVTHNAAPVARPDMSACQLWYKCDDVADPIVNHGVAGAAYNLAFDDGWAGHNPPTKGAPGGVFGTCISMPDSPTHPKSNESVRWTDPSIYGTVQSFWVWHTPSGALPTGGNYRWVWGSFGDYLMIRLCADGNVTADVNYTVGFGISITSPAGIFALGDLLFICVTHDGSVTRLYVNGVEQGHYNEVSTLLVNGWWCIGNATGSQSEGLYHDCGFDSTCFSPAQILALYHAVVP